jgi:hypothetical protein
MQDQVNATPAPKRVPWNKGKLTGAKPPLRPNHVCLGAFRPPAAGTRGQAVTPAAENLPQLRKSRRLNRFCRRAHPAMLFAKIIVVQSNTRLASEIDQRDTKHN